MLVKYYLSIYRWYSQLLSFLYPFCSSVITLFSSNHLINLSLRISLYILHGTVISVVSEIFKWYSVIPFTAFRNKIYTRMLEQFQK